jgi:pantoate--beta-alanine ligase
MKILYSNNDLNEALKDVSKLGFVPTMGSLHKGHISLIKRSKKECSKTIVSIFVNPTQFNDKSDYKKYPRNNKKDLTILRKLKIGFVYIPNKEDIYGSKKKQKIKLHKNDKILCAKYRKGHFEGVIDVMDRLINLIKPSKIYMGEKDFQQLFLVKKYVEKKYKTSIISCKTIRDKNGLALSSRNFFLSKKELQLASNLTKNLIFFKKKLIKKKNIKNLLSDKKKSLNKFYNIKIEYLELRNKINLKKTSSLKNSKIFIAYFLNKIRLIDNF